MKNLAQQVEKLISEQKQKDGTVKQQLEFLSQAQKSGVIKKPEYDLASVVNVATSS